MLVNFGHQNNSVHLKKNVPEKPPASILNNQIDTFIYTPLTVNEAKLSTIINRITKHMEKLPLKERLDLVKQAKANKPVSIKHVGIRSQKAVNSLLTGINQSTLSQIYPNAQAQNVRKFEILKKLFNKESK